MKTDLIQKVIVYGVIMSALVLAILACQGVFRGNISQGSADLSGAYVSYMPQMFESSFDLEKVLRKVRKVQSIVLTSEDRALITDQRGFVYEATPDGLNRQPILDIRDEIFYEGDAGLIGIITDPNYEENGYVYATATYTLDDGDGVIMRYVRYTDDRDAGTLNNPEVLLDNIVSGAMRPGGMLARGDDGYTYLVTGDLGREASDSFNVAGRLYRMNADGTPVTGTESLVADTGFGNPVAMVWLNATNAMWVIEL